MSVGLGALHRLLVDRGLLSVLLDAGVTREYFHGDEIKVFDVIREHQERYGVSPQITTVEVETGVHFQEFPDEPIGYWIDALERRAQSRVLARGAQEIMEQISDGELRDAFSTCRRMYLDLQRRSTADRIESLAELAEEVIAHHDRVQHSGGMSGIPLGIEYLDRVSDGAQPQDTIAVVGRPGSGKSYLMLKMALTAKMSGFMPLFVTMEMSTLQCTRRLVAMHAGVPSTMIRLGRLGYWGRDKLLSTVQWAGESGENERKFLLMRGSLTTTVEDVVLRVREVRPDIVFVDGAYLLRSRSKVEARWERVTETAEYLKMVASDFNIPLVSSYQFNRRGAGSLGNIAHADAIGQLASIVIGMDDEEDVLAGGEGSWLPRSYKILELLKGREGERGEVRILFDMNRMRIEQDSVIRGYAMDSDDGWEAQRRG